MLIRILHSADWHIDLKRRFEAHVAALAQMIIEAAAGGVDCFIFAGDFSGLDAPHHLRTRELLALIDLFTLACSFAPTIIIPGNHDEREQFQIFKKISIHPTNFHAILSPERRRIETVQGQLDIVAIPWLPKREILALSNATSIRGDNEEASRALTDWTHANQGTPSAGIPHILVGHYGVPGGIMGSVEVSTAFDVVLDLESFKDIGFDYIALGHLHRRQSVPTGCGKRVGWYSGSPVPLDFAETSQRGANYVTIGEKGQLNVSFQKINSWTMKTVQLHFNGTTIDGDIADEYVNAYVRLNIDVPRDARLLKKTKVFSDLEKLIKGRGALGVKINRIPMKEEHREVPVFLHHTSMEDRLMQVIEQGQYVSQRQEILAAFQQLRDRRIRREAESGYSE